MSGQLADLLALALAEHGPASGSRLARRVHARKCDVLAELRASPRFERDGRGRATRWGLAALRPRGTGQEPQQRDGRAERDGDAGPALRERLEALERRLDRVERQLAAPDPATNGIPGQIDVYEILAAMEPPAA